ncbi:MAG: iron-containing alcohol dehydrogenase [Candidatus Latescibacterota bacterium]
MPIITYLTTIQFDFGAVKLVGIEAEAVGISRPLVVTDPGVARCGVLGKVLEHIPDKMPVSIFEGTPENPTETAVLQALQVYRENECDGLIAVGGGSPMDLAKGVAILTAHTPPLEQYAAIFGGAKKISERVAPVIAIPTTAGTGSEVGRGAILTLNDGRKLGFASPNNIPKRAICDPELTFGLPRGLTAATGMDAVAHCVETFISPVINPPAEGIAIEGLRRAMAYIERAVADGTDREARWEMMMAAMMGAMSFQKGLGAVHAISHPLGGMQEPRLHHGTLNAVVMPAVLRFNANHVGDKYRRLKEAMGLDEGVDLPSFISEFNSKLGLPANLQEMGVPTSVVPAMSAAAEVDHCNATNPRPASKADYEVLINEAMG